MQASQPSLSPPVNAKLRLPCLRHCVWFWLFSLPLSTLQDVLVDHQYQFLLYQFVHFLLPAT